MKTINEKIANLKTNGYELQFETVFNKALENYKKEYSQYWNAILSGTGEIILDETEESVNSGTPRPKTGKNAASR